MGAEKGAAYDWDALADAGGQSGGLTERRQSSGQQEVHPCSGKFIRLPGVKRLSIPEFKGF